MEADDRRRRIEGAVAKYFERKGRGASIEPRKYSARFRDLADDIRITIEEVEGFKDVLKRIRPAKSAKLVRADDSIVGRMIEDYRLSAVLGQGSMGVVYRARNEAKGSDVALKLIRPDRFTEDAQVRFVNEMRILKRLKHAGIARLNGSGIIDLGDGDEPWIATELVDGESLHQHTRTLDQLEDKVALIHAICDSIAYAHRKRIVHRDLKPTNILIDAFGSPKIVDFGVARDLRGVSPFLGLETQAGGIIGTIPYMSPEQIQGDIRAIGYHTDVYSIGLISYRILSGAHPYRSSYASIPDAERVICRSVIKDFSDKSAPMIELNRIVQKALQKSGAKRYRNGGEMEEAVAGVLHRYFGRSIEAQGWTEGLMSIARRVRSLIFRA